MLTIQSALRESWAMLSASDSPQLDAELLLASALNKPREYLYTWPEKELSEEVAVQFQKFCQRRQKGHPVAYLLGQRSFWDFDLSINSNVLIPRPETELLVELCLEKLDSKTKTIADLGTGSGAIALALASENEKWQLIACDLSEEALKVARENSITLNIRNIEFRQGSWCEPVVETGLDAIVSNPPYIAENDEHLSQGDVRFEPKLALVCGDEGLADINTIAAQGLSKLKEGGLLFLEHGFQQGEAVRGILSEKGYTEIETHRDLSGNERVTCARVGK